MDLVHVDFGFTKTRRTLINLDRRFVEADLRFATGLIEPHFLTAGLGGRKVIAPGVAITKQSVPSIPTASWKIRLRFSAT